MISEGEALQRARAVAEERGWRWERPVAVTLSRRFIVFGRRRWHIRTNSEMRGCNVYIVVDGEDGAVLHAAYLPR